MALRHPLVLRPALVLGFGLLLGPALLGPSRAEASDPFYERRLAEGTLALEQGRPAEAAHSLEIAAFGLLDEPDRLIEALVRLALAQARLEDGSAFRATLRRISEVEERFGVYREADLAQAEREAFAGRILALTQPSVRERTPGLLPFLGGDEPRGKLAGEPTEQTATGDEAPPATRSGAVPLPPLTPAETERADRARAILARARRSEELGEAFDLARPLADAHPRRSELQHLVGEIAYRSSRWEQAIQYLRRGSDPLPGRPELLFYLAVSLYESGRVDEASTPLRRALPRLERTAFVDEYVTKILGAGDDAGNASLRKSGGAP